MMTREKIGSILVSSDREESWTVEYYITTNDALKKRLFGEYGVCISQKCDETGEIHESRVNNLFHDRDIAEEFIAILMQCEVFAENLTEIVEDIIFEKKEEMLCSC